MVNHAKSDNIAILAISRDDEFVASLADALQESRELLHARDMATAENLTIAHKIGVVVTDRGTTHDEIKAISSRLRPIVPQLVIVVAGDRRHANDLMDLITSGDIYRFLLTPLAPGQTRVCIESAITRYATMADHAPAGAQYANKKSPFNPMPWLAGAAITLLLVAGGWLLLSGGDEGPLAVQPPAPPPSTTSAIEAPPATTAQSRIAALERSLSLAKEALADGRFVEPIGANALYFYRSALTAEPENPEALQGLDTIAQALLERSNEALSSGDIDAARTSLAIVRSIQPQNPAIEALRARLGAQDASTAIASAQQLALAQDFDGALTILAEQPDTPEIQQVRANISGAQRDARVEASLQRMAVQIATDQLIEPANDSAHYHALAAASLAPQKPEVSAAVTGLGDLLVQRATEATAAGNFGEADRWLSAADSLGIAGDASDAAKAQNLAAIAAQTEARSRDAKNAERLALVTERIASNQLLDPDEDSAYFHLEQVRASDNENPGLSAAADQLADALLVGAGQRIADAQYEEADRLLDAAMTMGADAGAVAVERRAINSALEAQATALLPAFISTQQLTRTNYVAPVYPAIAQRRGQEGSVLLEFTLALDGTVQDIKVIESAPRSVFNRAAISALSRWEFEPFILNGQAQEVRVRVDMLFVLN